MSEQPTPPNAASTAPMKSANAATTNPLTQILGKIPPIAVSLWVSIRPTIAQALKATIGLLQSATDQLDRQIQTDKKPVKPLNFAPIQKAASTFWTKTQPLWAKLMGLIRSRLPADVTGKLTDRALSGIVAGFALLLLSVTTHLPSGNAAPKPKVVAVQPAVTVRPTVPSRPIAEQFPADTQGSQTDFPQSLTAPGTTPASPAAAPIVQPVPIVPTTPIVQADDPTPTERQGVGVSPALAARPLAPTTSIDQPIAPTQPTDLTTPIEQPTQAIAKPAPPAKLTRNQKLLAKLQAATPDRPNLLQTINPNQTQHNLQITLSPIWADLPVTEQDTLAQTLFTQAQTLRFATLELLNSAGDVLARSPVVGDEMVVLVRN
jgi:hypothetical protein